MRRLNYTDLLALLVEYDIDTLETHLRKMEQNRQSGLGREVREATNADILGK